MDWSLCAEQCGGGLTASCAAALLQASKPAEVGRAERMQCDMVDEELVAAITAYQVGAGCCCCWPQQCAVQGVASHDGKPWILKSIVCL